VHATPDPITIAAIRLTITIRRTFERLKDMGAMMPDFRRDFPRGHGRKPQ
jgi:hypothetical protein